MAEAVLAEPIGIETLGGVFTPLIAAEAKLPAAASQVFSTAEDSQSAVTIRVYQGMSGTASENRLLGSADLSGILPAPKGVPQIEVTFSVSEDGELNVTAIDKGLKRQIRVNFAEDTRRVRVRSTPGTQQAQSGGAAFDDIFGQVFGGAGAQSRAQSGGAPQSEAPARGRLFVSHASPDSDTAHSLVSELEANGHSCWIAPRDVRAGYDFRAEIVDALKSASGFMVLISQGANSSPHVLREVAMAEQYGKRIVPLRLDDTPLRSELEYLLVGLHWVRYPGSLDAILRTL